MTIPLDPDRQRQVDALQALTRVGMVAAYHHFQWHPLDRRLPQEVVIQMWVEAVLGFALGHELVVPNGNAFRQTGLEIPLHLHPNPAVAAMAYRQRMRLYPDDPGHEPPASSPPGG